MSPSKLWKILILDNLPFSWKVNHPYWIKFSDNINFATLTKSILESGQRFLSSFNCMNMPLSATTIIAANTHWKYGSKVDNFWPDKKQTFLVKKQTIGKGLSNGPSHRMTSNSKEHENTFDSWKWFLKRVETTWCFFRAEQCHPIHLLHVQTWHF